MPGSGGLSAVIGWRSRDRFALRLLIQELDAQGGVLAALKALHGVLAAAKARLHLFGVVASELDRTV
jgi:hypothetical protein